MALTDHSAILWMDSSIYFLTSYIAPVLHYVQATSGVILFAPTLHSTFAVTHKNMFQFLPTEQQVALRVQQQTVAIYVRTKTVVRDVIRWYVYCALDERCIAPTRQLICDFADFINTYANCHRFDQSALNIILANRFTYCNVTYNVNDVSKSLMKKVRIRYS